MPRLGTRNFITFKKNNKVTIGRDALFKLLGQEGLLIIKKKRYTKTTNSKHWRHQYPNPIKSKEVRRPEQVWLADIPYLSLVDSYAYLHLKTGSYSKQIVGYHVKETLAASSTLSRLLKNNQYNYGLIL
jgi:transposase InsO family protein